MQANSFKILTNHFLSLFNLSVVNKTVHDRSVETAEAFQTMVKTIDLKDAPFLPLLAHLSPEQRKAIYPYLILSKSQLFQDLFAISQSLSPGFPRFFVEFGATDGIRLSNTYVLEKYLNWKGILAEPAKVWHSELKANRNCKIDFNCVSDQSNRMVEFIEASVDPKDPQSSPELSSMAAFAESGDIHSERRIRNCKKYSVPTISLNDLLAKYSAPADIGYLSIDTEGSELSILASTDWNRYRFRVISVEHNYVEEQRTAIHNLSTKNNYNRVLEEVSHWDDWYVLSR